MATKIEAPFVPWSVPSKMAEFVYGLGRGFHLLTTVYCLNNPTKQTTNWNLTN